MHGHWVGSLWAIPTAENSFSPPFLKEISPQGSLTHSTHSFAYSTLTPEAAGTTACVCVCECVCVCVCVLICSVPSAPLLSAAAPLLLHSSPPPPSLPPLPPQSLRGQGRSLYVSTFGGIAYNNNYPINACMYFERYPTPVFR